MSQMRFPASEIGVRRESEVVEEWEGSLARRLTLEELRMKL
jgi:hypothetical protein